MTLAITGLKEPMLSTQNFQTTHEIVDQRNLEARQLCNSNPKLALEKALEARQLAQSNDYLEGLALSWHISAVAHQIESEYQQGLIEGQNALKLYQELKDLKGEASVLGNFAIVYAELCDYKTALDYYQQAVSIFEKLDDKALLANVLGNLAGIYVSLEQYQSALTYYFKAFQLLEPSAGKNFAAIAFLLNGIGYSYLRLNHYEKALAYLQYAKSLVNQTQDKRRLGDIYLGLGEAYRQLQQPQFALFYFKEVLTIYHEIGDKRGLANALLETGKLYFQINEIQNALNYYKHALELATKKGVREVTYSTHKAFTQLYHAQGDFAKALEHHEYYAQAKIEASSSENQKVLAALQFKFQLEQAEKERELFRLRNVELANALAEVEKANQQIAKLNASLQSENLALQRELKVGRQIQADFLPDALPELEGWQMTVYFEPACEVAGDFYDVFKLPNNLVGIVTADVCDKGVGAALFMSLIRSLLRMLAYQACSSRLQYLGSEVSNYLVPVANIFKEQPPLLLPVYTFEILKSVKLVNDYLTSNHSKADMFATLFFGVLDTETGLLSYINGGHEAPIHLNAHGIKTRLQASGPAVGVLPRIDYSVQQICLAPGDALFTYTDGVTEARSPQGNFYSEKQLLEVIIDCCGKDSFSTHYLLDTINASLQTHVATAQPSDDITMVALCRLPKD